MQVTPIQELRNALEAHNKTDRYRQSVGFKLVSPTKLKHLAQAVEPTAAVHRTAAGMYQCRVAGRPIDQSDRVHSTPIQAWAYLARHLIRRHQADNGNDGGAADVAVNVVKILNSGSTSDRLTLRCAS